MASAFLISPFTEDVQAAVLSKYPTAKRCPLPFEQAGKVATTLNLASGGAKTELAKKLAAERARYGIALNHTGHRTHHR